ncbi:19070_t:CDS:2 [Dentiscutata erythropus]|uniref:19070_t:CDS:1 n=1 Tax=Dentiscutata erythropus TaxID=1348616 RepID=A0A9N8ZXL8_9GLOM|nr:19070_t:CDS:2 [Dentiscutata erythropus]
MSVALSSQPACCSTFMANNNDHRACSNCFNEKPADVRASSKKLLLVLAAKQAISMTIASLQTS